MNGDGRVIHEPGAAAVIDVERSVPWRDFEASATADVPCLVANLWPEGALGFIAAPPKARKTWLALGLALSVATGRPLLGHFAVAKPRPVLLVMLEGHRAAIRARIGCLARGLGLDPDSDDLANLHVWYKPRGINLADPTWAQALAAEAARVDAALVIVDVLRMAAAIREKEAEDFAKLRVNLQPLADAGRSVALVHHFIKLSETSRERSPGERMSGSGAMGGALDVGLFITSATKEPVARVEVVLRDLAEPPPFGFRLDGKGSLLHGGYGYRDACRLVLDEPPGPADVKGPAAAIAEWVRARGRATPKEIRDHFTISDGTLRNRRVDLARLGISYVDAGSLSVYETYPATPRNAAIAGCIEPTPQTPYPSGEEEGVTGASAGRSDFGVRGAITGGDS